MRERFDGRPWKNALVVAGQRQPMEVHLLAHAINSALGAIGNTVTLLPATENAGADLKNLDCAARRTRWSFSAAIRLTHLNWSPTAKAEDGCSARLLRGRNVGKIRLEFSGGALSRIVGRCDHQRRNARSDSAVDSAAVWRIDGIGISRAHCWRIADESSRNCPRNVSAAFRTRTWKKFLFNGF